MSYRRKRSIAGETLAETTFIANRLSWKGAAILGLLLFVIFYWLLPIWINNRLSLLQKNMFRPMVETIFAPQVHWVQWLDIALVLVCTFFAVRNYFVSERLDRYGEHNVNFFSRLLARWLD